MLARAAERNPSVFNPHGQVCNVTNIIPKLLNIAEYTENPWGNTKFLLSQFKPSPPPISDMPKARRKEIQEVITRSKSLADVTSGLEIELGTGEEFFRDLKKVLDAREKEHGKSGEGKDIFDERKEAEEDGTAGPDVEQREE